MGLSGPVRFGDRQGSLTVEMQLPPTFVSKVMMFAAERQHVADIGPSATAPIAQVVHRAVVERHVTIPNGTAAVHHSQRSPLMNTGKPGGTAEVKQDTIGAKHSRNDVGVTSHAADRLNRQRHPTGNVDTTLGVGTIEQRLQIDHHGELGSS